MLNQPRPDEIDRLLDSFVIVYDAQEQRTLGTRDLHPRERRTLAVSMLVVNLPEGEPDNDSWQ